MLSRRCGRPASAARGVGLVEVMVTLVLLVALLSQVLPTISDWLQGLKLRNAAEAMRGGLERARLEALKRNSNVGFWIVSDANSKVPGNDCAQSSSSAAWVVSVLNPAGKCAAAPALTGDPQLVQRSTAPENLPGLTVSALSAGGGAANHVTFNGLGQVVADVDPIQTIDFSLASGAGRRLRVVVEGGGAVRMCDRDVGATDPRACPAL